MFNTNGSATEFNLYFAYNKDIKYSIGEKVMFGKEKRFEVVKSEGAFLNSVVKV